MKLVDDPEIVVDAEGEFLTIDGLDKVMRSITFDEQDFDLAEPTFRFETKNGTVYAYDDRRSQAYSKHHYRWAYADKRKPLLVARGSYLERWLNDQLTQRVLKMVVEE